MRYVTDRSTNECHIARTFVWLLCCNSLGNLTVQVGCNSRYLESDRNSYVKKVLKHTVEFEFEMDDERVDLMITKFGYSKRCDRPGGVR